MARTKKNPRLEPKNEIATDIFVEAAPRLIDKGVKWLFKNLPRKVS